ncbi:hypothetical protein C2869_19415 [Saccharobesus litoralis]|uniref:Uncharacterized protein n=1 Tax=Saccharobesus litoralis TaxID=2172099 RepID=A0A2S0VW95_9ALTE|nr:hypothetical protein [Saccharobesus litoralis]AWB68442.1 hypothetical protein C2869_19415 [Saccharobesus litoralis]
MEFILDKEDPKLITKNGSFNGEYYEDRKYSYLFEYKIADGGKELEIDELKGLKVIDGLFFCDIIPNVIGKHPGYIRLDSTREKLPYEFQIWFENKYWEDITIFSKVIEYLIEDKSFLASLDNLSTEPTCSFKDDTGPSLFF